VRLRGSFYHSRHLLLASGGAAQENEFRIQTEVHASGSRRGDSVRTVLVALPRRQRHRSGLHSGVGRGARMRAGERRLRLRRPGVHQQFCESRFIRPLCKEPAGESGAVPTGPAVPGNGRAHQHTQGRGSAAADGTEGSRFTDGADV